MDDTAMQIEFLRITQRFRKMHLIEVFGSTPRGEFFALDMLEKHKHLHPEATGMYVSDLAARMHVSPPAVSRTLKSLEAKGHIVRTVDENDRRNTYIQITQQGAQFRALKREGLQTFTRTVFEEVGEENMETLLMLWDKLIDAMERQIKNMNENEGEA